MDPISSLLAMTLASCEVCDALAAGTSTHPFAINPAWVPKCDRAEEYIQADPWPAANEVRRDSFTRDCADIRMTRSFVSAADGFTGDEFYVSTLVERKRGRDVMQVRQHEFIGTIEGYSYRYSFIYSNDGQALRAAGSIETPKITSHVVGTALAPAVRPKSLGAQSVTCEVWWQRCELVSRRVANDVALPFFAVQFDKAHPEGNLCIGVPDATEDEPAPVVDISADGRAVVDRLQATVGQASTCLGDASKDALAAFGQAKSLTYRVVRNPSDPATAWDTVQLDTTGLAEALDLSRFLLKGAIIGGERRQAETTLKPRADAMLDGQVVTN